MISIVVADSKALLDYADQVLKFSNEVESLHPSIPGAYEEVRTLRKTIDDFNRILASPSLIKARERIQERWSMWPAIFRLNHDCSSAFQDFNNYVKSYKYYTTRVIAGNMIAKPLSESEREIQVLGNRIRG